MGTPITLYTCNNFQRQGLIPAQYFLEYRGDELHMAAVFHMKMGAPNPRHGVLHLSATGMRWILPNQYIRDAGVRHGDTICVIPIPNLPPEGGGRFQAPAQTFAPRISAPGRTLEQLRVRLADYPKIKDIGRGAFGALYSARDPRTGGLVAVKVMRNDMTSESDERMFDREVEILASVDHHTLLGFRGWVPLHGREPPAILTEFMPNGSLQAVITLEEEHKAPPEWTPTRKFIALYGTAVGMMILHQNRIIHRDLKLDNVLLDERFEPKVADFGLSKFVGQGATVMQTMRGGTAPYMAPEIYDGNADYAFPVDVYAFAILVYCAVTFLNPFPGVTSAFQLGQKVCRGDRPKIPSFVGSNWRQLIEACWAGEPAQRPTFDAIVQGMGSSDFMDATIDRGQVLAYQQRVVPPELHLNSPPGQAVAPAARTKSPIERLKEAADAGDAFAANQYGERLKAGNGVKEDAAAAAEYFRRAAQAGDLQGMVNYGLALEAGQGVPKNHPEAARWYKAAMDKGSPAGAWAYADMLEYGKGVPKNPSEAVRCYKKAAQGGDARAQARYGLILENGMLGVAQNMREAVAYYKMSSDQGNAQGMFFYADMLEFGKGVPKNMGEAVKLYMLAAEKGHIGAIGKVGFLMVKGDGVPQDLEKGIQLMLIAALKGDSISFVRVGQIMEEVGKPAEAFKNYKLAADNGNPVGIFHAARMLEDGKGVKQDAAQAAQLYQQLIDQLSDTDAMIRLGLMKIQGKGVRKDAEAGLRLIKRAADAGHSAAKELLRQVR